MGRSALRFRVGIAPLVLVCSCFMASVNAASSTMLERAHPAPGLNPNHELPLVEVHLEDHEKEPLAPDDVVNPFLEPLSAIGGACDLNGDGVCNCGDIDQLTDVLAGGGMNPELDLDGNGIVDFDDRDYLITNLMDSTLGDADQDGVFDPGDLISVFSDGFYDDPMPSRPVSYCEGDWNGDGVFDSSDIVLAFEESVFTPEPSASLLFVFGLCGTLLSRRQA